MRFRPYRAALLAAATLAAPAPAETLREALLKAYQGNPTLTGQRAAQRANDENVPIERSFGLPSLNANGTYTEQLIIPGNNPFAAQRQVNAGANLGVPLYLGGRVRNATRAARSRVEAGQAQLRGTEADLFTEVVGAYMDVIRDDAIVQLNAQQVRVLDVNLRASRDRFEVGDVTRTDVAQSEARLALARADLQSAEAQLIASRENYVRLVGTPPTALADPPPLPNLPATPEDAVTSAIEDNPALAAAARQREAARYDVGVARSERMPRLNGVAGGNYFNALGSIAGQPGFNATQSTTGASAGVQLAVPLFQGGRPGALVRQAQAREGQAIENVTATERFVVSQTRSAFAINQSTRQVIASAEAAVAANKLALEGVRAENSVGTRTVLDILDAEQELLNSQVTLVSARRDAYVAGFALLAAMGEAEARDLGLDGGALYDPTVNYRRVRRRLNDFDSDPAPQPVAAGTSNVPRQTARPERRLDPSLDDAGVDRRPGLTTGSSAPDRR